MKFWFTTLGQLKQQSEILVPNAQPVQAIKDQFKQGEILVPNTGPEQAIKDHSKQGEILVPNA